MIVKNILSILYFTVLLSFIACGTQGKEDAEKCIWKSTDDTPTGRVVVYETPKDSYSQKELKSIARILVDKQCNGNNKESIRVVLQNKNGDQLGILGKLCKKDKYFGELN